MARVKPSIRPTETYTEPNFLRLHTISGSAGSEVRLATIEHLSYRADPQADHKGWRCQTIVDGEAMSKEDAMFIASTYARENDIPVIYECHSE
jgi:hypothetical protein